jgi:hypothetical protein
LTPITPRCCIQDKGATPVEYAGRPGPVPDGGIAAVAEPRDPAALGQGDARGRHGPQNPRHRQRCPPSTASRSSTTSMPTHRVRTSRLSSRSAEAFGVRHRHELDERGGRGAVTSVHRTRPVTFVDVVVVGAGHRGSR